VRSYKNILLKIEKEWPFSREETLRLMHMDNMLSRPYYWPPLHKKEMSYKTLIGPIKYAERLSEEYILIPSGEFVTLDDIHKIADYLDLLSNNADAIKEELNHEYK